jgi:hypothetical protein
MYEALEPFMKRALGNFDTKFIDGTGFYEGNGFALDRNSDIAGIMDVGHLAGLEVDFLGRGSHTGRRAARKRAAPVQAEGTAGGHHQGSETSLLLPEARREETRKGGFGTQAESQEGS